MVTCNSLFIHFRCCCCCCCRSTPATVGAITGVGLWEGRKGFNGRLLLKMISGWVVTIIAAVSITCLFMAQGLYAPSKDG